MRKLLVLASLGALTIWTGGLLGQTTGSTPPASQTKVQKRQRIHAPDYADKRQGQGNAQGQQAGQGRKAKGRKHAGPGYGTGNQGAGPKDGTGYGAQSGRRSGPMDGTGWNQGQGSTQGRMGAGRGRR